LPSPSSNDEVAIRAREEFASKLRKLRTKTELGLGKKLTRDEIVRKVDEAGSPVSGGTVSAWLLGKRIPLDRKQAKHLIQVLGEKAPPEEKDAALATWENTTEELDELRYRQATPRYKNDGIVDELLVTTPDDLSSGRYISATSGISESAMVTNFRNNMEFYSAGLEQALTATRIKVTYIRHCPPASITAEGANHYFRGLVEWARNDGTHQFQRIIGVPVTDGTPNIEMLDWVREHAAETANIRNYELRAFSWTARGDCANIALMDDDVSFFAISGMGSDQDLRGCRVHSPILNKMLTMYFDQLWLGVDPVQKYLRSFD
jgi:hypothetical protein